MTSCVSYEAEDFTGHTLPRKTGYSTGVTNDWLYFDLKTGHRYNVLNPNQSVIAFIDGKPIEEYFHYKGTTKLVKYWSEGVQKNIFEDAERTFAVRNMSADPTTQVSISTTQGNHARLDFLELNYTRRLSVDDAYLHFRGDKSTATEFVLSNPSGRNLAVWRLGDASRLPVRMSGQAAGTTYRFKAERASDQYVAVDVDAEFPKPE